MNDGIASRLGAPFAWALAPLVIALACGGKSNSAGPEPSGGGSESGGSGGAIVSRAGDSSSLAGRENRAGSSSQSGGSSAAHGGTSAAGGLPISGSGGSSMPGAAGEGGGAGAAPCLDVCEREGQACCFDGGECVAPSGDCTIDVLAGQIDTTRDYEQIAARVAALSPELLLSLSDRDVASAEIDAPFAARQEIVLSAEASARAAPLEHAELHPFRLSCSGQELFVGIVYGQSGAAAIDAPVMHVSRNPDNRLVLRLGAWQSAWAGFSTTPEREPFRQRLDRPELRAALCRDGVLEQF